LKKASTISFKSSYFIGKTKFFITKPSTMEEKNLMNKGNYDDYNKDEYVPDYSKIDNSPETVVVEKKKYNFKLLIWQIIIVISVGVAVTTVYCSWALLSVSFPEMEVFKI
jgi:hypothetical protein